MYIRVFKEALRSGGGQLTPKHVEDVSMAVLFLSEASETADEAFGVAPQTTAHSIIDSQKDVTLMSTRLIESVVTTFDRERQTPPFVDPATAGWKKLTTTNWLQDTIQKSHTLADREDDDDDDHLQDEDVEEADLLYALSDVT